MRAENAAGYASLVLAGGAARRLGGEDKPALVVGGQPLLSRVLDAVADAAPRIVVGPARHAPADVLVTREEPPGSGPLAAIAAGLALVPAHVTQVALLAADLPFLTPEAVQALRAAATDHAAVFVDDHGQRQYLCAVWQSGALRQQLATLGAPGGMPLRHLYDDMMVAEIRSSTSPPPWYDCDTQAELDRARSWS